MGICWKTDGSAATACSTFFRESGTEKWKRAQDLWWDNRTAGDYHAKEYRGSIVGLTAGTEYEISLRLSSGGNSELTASTWPEVEDLPVAKTVTVESQESGYIISQSGTESGYVLYSGTDAVISGGNKVGVTIKASYVILKGLTITDVGKHGLEIETGHDIIIDDCDISEWGTKNGDFQTEDDCGIWSESCEISRITIQNCKIHHPRYDANNWKEFNEAEGTEHPTGANAISLECQEEGNTAGNYVIRHNRIYSDYTHMFNDGMGADNNFSYDGFPIRDSDIHDNFISHVWDDGLEIEGGNVNVRVWGNVLDSINIAFGLATTSIGPLYVFRNISRWGQAYTDKGFGWEMFKIGINDPEWNRGAMFLYHNTIRQPDNHGLGEGIYPTKDDGIQNYITSRNNIIDVLTNSIRSDAETTMPNSTFDYDFCTGAIPNGVESHGITEGTPEYAAGTDMLTETSPGYDAGIVLWNFNDPESAWPYTGKGPDMGASEAEGDDPVPTQYRQTSFREFSYLQILRKSLVFNFQGMQKGFILLCDLKGRTISREIVKANSTATISTAGLPAESYVLKVISGSESASRTVIAGY
jgi:hypothetical protein